MFWKVVDEDLAVILEEAYQNGSETCEWVYDGWRYTYNMVTNKQTSQMTGAERAIRRVSYQEAYPHGGDEDWD